MLQVEINKSNIMMNYSWASTVAIKLNYTKDKVGRIMSACNVWTVLYVY